MKTSLVVLVISSLSLAAPAFSQAASRDERPLASAVRDALQRDPRGSPEAQRLAGQRRIDQQVALSVNQLLSEAGLTNFVVACHDGQVELRGPVADAAQRQHATELALGLPDVRGVRNAMLAPGEDAAAPAAPALPVEPAPPAASHEQVNAALLAVLSETGEPLAGSSTEPFGFATTDGYAGRGVVVDEVEGVVRLRGDVNTPNARNYAENAARAVTGVRVLRNELVVRPSTLNESRRLALVVQHQFDYDQLVQPVAPLILVTVQDGVVRLEGTVQEDSQLQQAEDLAAAQTGVFAVENRLVVDEDVLAQPVRRGPVTIVRSH